MIEFKEFASISRLSRNCTVTEKLDGSNAQVYIEHRALVSPDDLQSKTALVLTPDYVVFAGSRNRWLTPHDDNFGFASFVDKHFDMFL